MVVELSAAPAGIGWPFTEPEAPFTERRTVAVPSFATLSTFHPMLSDASSDSGCDPAEPRSIEPSIFMWRSYVVWSPRSNAGASAVAAPEVVGADFGRKANVPIPAMTARATTAAITTVGRRLFSGSLGVAEVQASPGGAAAHGSAVLDAGGGGR